MASRRVSGLLLPVFLVTSASVASAAPILDRATLNALLGASAITESFESFAVADGTFAFVGAVLDATSVPGGQGPNLIVPGLQLSTSPGSVIWQGNNFFGLPTKTMGAEPATNLVLDFLLPVSAFGLDLLNYGGFPATYQVTVFGIDDVTILATVGGITFPAPVTPTFFGYEFAGGIGRVRVDAIAGFGPVVDNLTFGTVPEPASMLLLGTGLVAIGARACRRRRSPAA